jgi:lactoylglutathione lyase
MTMRLAHLAIKVENLEEAGEFYEKFLGFRDVRQGVNRDHYSRHLTDGNIDIALLKYDTASRSKEALAAGEGPGIHHFGFEVDDLPKFLDEIKKRGLEVVSDPGVVPIKFRVPGGAVAEVAPKNHFKVS